MAHLRCHNVSRHKMSQDFLRHEETQTCRNSLAQATNRSGGDVVERRCFICCCQGRLLHRPGCAGCAAFHGAGCRIGALRSRGLPESDLPRVRAELVEAFYDRQSLATHSLASRCSWSKREAAVGSPVARHTQQPLRSTRLISFSLLEDIEPFIIIGEYTGEVKDLVASSACMGQ